MLGRAGVAEKLKGDPDGLPVPGATALARRARGDYSVHLAFVLARRVRQARRVAVAVAVDGRHVTHGGARAELDDADL